MNSLKKPIGYISSAMYLQPIYKVVQKIPSNDNNSDVVLLSCICMLWSGEHGVCVNGGDVTKLLKLLALKMRYKHLLLYVL